MLRAMVKEALHAANARKALAKMCTLPLLAGETYPQRSCRL